MKKIQSTLFFLFFAALVCQCSLKPLALEPVLKDVTPAEADVILKQNQINTDFVLIDVRTPAEYNESHISHAINVDFYGTNFQQELQALDKGKTYMIYCRSGNRSSQTFSKMKDLKFRRVYHLLGGMNQWKQEGFSVVSE